jgi:type I restriction enzyme S subunit
VDVVDWHAIGPAFRKVIEKQYVVVQNARRKSPGMAGEWATCTLADACSAIDYGLTASASEHENGPKFLRITDIVTGQIDWKSVPHVLADDHTLAKYKLHDGDIVLARTGASTGASAYVKTPPTAVFASYLVRLQAKAEFDPRFLAYYLKSDDFWTFIRGVLGDKSAQPNASASTMTKAPLRAPRDKAEQRAIAHILGTLDDKIELNRRMSETLEAIARALFKSWFVDFDPVRAKAESRWRKGKSLPSLPANLYDLFPARLVDSELGEIPEGWGVKAFADTVEVIGGGTPKTSVAEYWDGDVPWFSVVDAPAEHQVWVINTEKKITRAGVDNSSTKILPIGTTIISARGTVGRVALVGVPMAMNQSCYGLRGKVGSHGFFNYFSTRQLVSTLQQRSHGSVFDTITRDTLKGVLVPAPNAPVIEAFEVTVSPILARIRQTLLESRTLAALRDTLLPKLISGELRARDAERFLERVV